MFIVSGKVAIRLLAAFLLASALLPRPAYAYIDPVSGSAILQALAAGALAAAFMMRSAWHRIIDGFRRFWHRVTR